MSTPIQSLNHILQDIIALSWNLQAFRDNYLALYFLSPNLIHNRQKLLLLLVQPENIQFQSHCQILPWTKLLKGMHLLAFNRHVTWIRPSLEPQTDRRDNALPEIIAWIMKYGVKHSKNLGLTCNPKLQSNLSLGMRKWPSRKKKRVQLHNLTLLSQGIMCTTPEAGHPSNERGEPTASYRWTGRVWEMAGWSSRLQEITNHFGRIYGIIRVN